MGAPLGTKKIEKSRAMPKKVQKGDPTVSSGFVSFRFRLPVQKFNGPVKSVHYAYVLSSYERNRKTLANELVGLFSFKAKCAD